MDIEYKAVQGQIKAIDESGAGVLRFITLNREDHDADITRRGFVGIQRAHLLPNHNWRSDLPPVGDGESYDDDTGTYLKFQLSLGTYLGDQWHKHLKFAMRNGAARSLQQLSYGFRPYPDGQELMMHDGRQLRVLKPKADGSPGCELIEVSFVTKAAGVDTGVLDLKSMSSQSRGGPRIMLPKSHFVDAETAFRSARRCFLYVERKLGEPYSEANARRMREEMEEGLTHFDGATEHCDKGLDALESLALASPAAPPTVAPPVTTPPPAADPKPLASSAPAADGSTDEEKDPDTMGEKGGNRPLEEQIDAVLRETEDLTVRLEGLKRLRGTPNERYPNGRPMSAERLAQVEDFMTRLSRLKETSAQGAEVDATQQDYQAMAERFKKLGVKL